MRGDGGRLVAGRYRITGRLGRGGMGTVWRADDELLGRRVAVKELHAEGDEDRALREARTVARIRHPHVIVLFDVVEQDGSPWIVMELVDGRSLADVLAQDGPLPPREAARIGAAVTGALRAAHERGVLHRDIKPGNVLVEHGTGRIVLTDFGIARVTGATTLTEAGDFVGSPEYTAPERMSGQAAGPASDLWSVGVLLCAAVVGRSPFRRDSLGEVLHAVVFEEIRPPERTGPLLPVVEALLRREPERRPTARETEELLAAYAETGVPPTAVPAPVPGTETERQDAPLPRARRRRGPLAAVLAVAVLAGAGVAAASLLPDGGSTGGAAPDRTTVTSGAPARTSPSAASAPADPASATPALPAGFRTVDDPAGFSLALPEGFRRSLEPPRIFYYSAGKEFRVGIRAQRPDPRGPEAVMRAQDAAGADAYQGYRDGFVTPTTQNGHPAALWQFTWDGFTPGVPRRTFDLCWEEGGRQYDLWVSSPLQQAERGRDYFDTARAAFRAG
ncbi:serine/threonine-protein kinase [Actinacidiphila glaucinigra]|uniref:non-specific serine/threonine protein kinase n=1 Tax=Actinacidiphila glaucinigra TaxID=235986 RepID=A0A239FHD8_9ACTN|nr:serine/threonine-protein kinase [Actinacidiphila glaucinigra]SNS56165.1 Serine/threonine protein kinase [Actinacidiphila glaucinigra]